MKNLLSAALLVALAKAGDLGEELTAETEKDGSASEHAECWCKALSEELASRDREGESQISYLKSQKDIYHYDNVGIRHEIESHDKQAAEHQRSIDAGSAIAGRDQEAFEEDQAFHENALESIRKAKAKLPPGSGGEARGALRGLEKSFQDKMDSAKEAQGNQMNGVLDAKAEMMRLATAASETKSKRLAKGLTSVENFGAQLELYDEQSESDMALNGAMQNLCGALHDGTSARVEKRQKAQIALSQANVKSAEAVAAHSRSKLALVKRVGGVATTGVGSPNSLALETVTTSDKNLMELGSKSQQIQGDLKDVLSNMVMNAHLTQSSNRIDEPVKKAIESLGEEAKANLAQMPQLFDAMRAAILKSSRVDERLQNELRVQITAHA